jgi:hypothetical protein
MSKRLMVLAQYEVNVTYIIKSRSLLSGVPAFAPVVY